MFAPTKLKCTARNIYSNAHFAEQNRIVERKVPVEREAPLTILLEYNIIITVPIICIWTARRLIIVRRNLILKSAFFILTKVYC